MGAGRASAARADEAHTRADHAASKRAEALRAEVRNTIQFRKNIQFTSEMPFNLHEFGRANGFPSLIELDEAHTRAEHAATRRAEALRAEVEPKKHRSMSLVKQTGFRA